MSQVISTLTPRTPGLCKPGTDHSLYFSFPDGSLWVQLKGSRVKSCIYAHKLTTVTDFFNNLINMAKDKDAEPAFTQQGDGAESQSGTSSSIFQSSGNGQTEHAPLLIQGSEAGFEAFLECVFGEYAHSTLYRQPAIFWLQALQVIDLYDAPPILNIANHHLSAARDLDPAIRLHLAMHYHLDEWVDAGFRGLLQIPLADLTQAQITNIGFSAYIILAEVKAKITEHRTLCALACPPVIHNDGCRDHVGCSQAPPSSFSCYSSPACCHREDLSGDRAFF
ncbi:hypothetical protein R3P38DRAFT_2590845 [Favolaschia claudopus]|uniref:BTB domain-containing protein n=1 Tax=Favolaschia claudopus TaxID=2862362 RepID=A0AAV9YZC8_9AGAR